MKILKEKEFGINRAKASAGVSRMVSLSVPLVLGAVLCLAVSCDRSSGLLEEKSTSANKTMSLSLKVRTTAVNADYEVGSTYENYIDIAGGDYKVYFFTNDPLKDGNDTYLAAFEPNDLIPRQGTNYIEYGLLGQVSNDFAEYVNETGNFKVMVLANWGEDNYPADGDLTVGTTTIDDICSSPSWGQFTYKTNFTLGQDNLLPFYGIHEYKGVSFREGVATILTEPICLLRTMAKVEVIVEGYDSTHDLHVDDAVIQGCNSKGYCAPAGVYTHDDYSTGSGTIWYYDYDEMKVHLVNNGSNDSDSSSRQLEMIRTEVGDETQGTYDTWRAYVPEYDNLSSPDDYSRIKVTVGGYGTDGSSSQDYFIYFRDYIDGVAASGADYDILRNTVYRFHVTIIDGYFRVEPQHWEYTFDNDFTITDEDDSSDGD